MVRLREVILHNYLSSIYYELGNILDLEPINIRQRRPNSHGASILSEERGRMNEYTRTLQRIESC